MNSEILVYFMTNCPETIPDWFEHTKADRPKKYIYWTEYTDNDLFELHKDELRSWHRDPCFDLVEELR